MACLGIPTKTSQKPNAQRCLTLEATQVHKQLDTDADSALELLRNLEHHSRVQARENKVSQSLGGYCEATPAFTKLRLDVDRRAILNPKP